MASAEGTSLVRGVWGYPPPEDFQIWRLRNAIFSTCVMRYVSEKSTSNMKMANNCKSLKSK